MRLLRVALVLALALAVQAALGRLWPGVHRYLDLLLVPTVWYGISASQRSGMLVGCAAGLLHDAWFEIGVFGLNGFKKTLIGWLVGGLGTRFDLNRGPTRFVFGALAAVIDSLLDGGLRRMLGQEAAWPAASDTAIRAVVTGLVLVWASAVARRFHERREVGYRR